MKSFLVLCVALVVLETTRAAVIAPGIIDYNGCGCGCNGIPSSIFAPALSPYSPIIDFPSCSNNIIAPIIPSCSNNVIAPVIPSCSNTILAPMPSCSNTVIPAGIPSYSSAIVGAPNNVIVQPSVASSLADTLSLLTVSSLLAETLPLQQTLVVPSCGCGLAPSCGCGLAPSCGCGLAPSCGCGLSYGGYYF